MGPVDVTVMIPEPVLPLHRHDLYIQPVVDELEAVQLGTYGGDAGTHLARDHKILSIDFILRVESLDAIALITRTLDQLGAPQGSRLVYSHEGRRVEMPFGTVQAVAIFVDTTNPSALAGLTPDQLVQAIHDAGCGECRYGRPSSNEFGLYFYGDDAEAMFTRMQPVLRMHPLGRLSRVVVRYGGIDPREERVT